MRAPTAERSLLVLGDAEHASPIAAELRASAARVTVAGTVSELRELLAHGLRPTLLIIDARGTSPWRADALVRMAELARTPGMPMLCIGELRCPEAIDAAVRTLPADASLGAIVSAVGALEGRAPYGLRAPSHPGLSDA